MEFLFAAPCAEVALEEVAVDMCPVLSVYGICYLKVAYSVADIWLDVDGVWMIGLGWQGQCCDDNRGNDFVHVISELLIVKN